MKIAARAFLFVAIAFLAQSYAAPVSFWFDHANTLYEQKQYDSAAQYYEKILDAGTSNSAVYFNAGNCYFRVKKTGMAILYFEKALKLTPGDADISANISFANSTIVDKLPEPPQSFVGAILSRLHTLVPLHMQLWLLVALLFLLAALFVLFLRVSQNARLWIIYTSSILLFVTIGLGISVGVKIYAAENISSAIVLSPSLDAKNQPDGNKVLFTVHEGTKFRIRKIIGDWALVSLPTGVSGWVQMSSIGVI